jgi:hypothetical protein
VCCSDTVSDVCFSQTVSVDNCYKVLVLNPYYMGDTIQALVHHRFRNGYPGTYQTLNHSVHYVRTPSIPNVFGLSSRRNEDLEDVIDATFGDAKNGAPSMERGASCRFEVDGCSRSSS